MDFHSQYQQDRLLHQFLFQGLEGGTFVDIGAHDGVTLSNSLFFEKNLGWQGICVEADPSSFADLQRNRPTAVNLNLAAGSASRSAAFIQVEGYSQMLSGFAAAVDHDRIDREIAEHGGKKRIVSVDVRRVDSLLREQDITSVHYLSLDVEGAELDVLAGIDFSAVEVHAMTIEYGSSSARRDTQRLLRDRFICAGRFGTDLFFVNRSGIFAHRAADLRRELTRLRGSWLARMLPRWRRALKARAAAKSGAS